MQIKGVIFDMDGLMFDTERIYYKGWQEAARAYGYEITWEIYTQIVARNSTYIGMVLRKLLGEDFPFEAVNTKKRAISDEIVAREGIKLKKGLEKLLDYLESKGMQKAVATSSMREKAVRYLEIGGVKARYEAIICGSDVAESKPNPEIFLRAAASLGLKPEECLVLEDSRLGIEAAKRAGMTGIFIPDLVAADDEIRGYASEVLASLEEVITFLENIRG